MNDITATAIQDCQAKKRELAAEVVQLREDLRHSENMRGKALEMAAKWEQTCCEIHDARILAEKKVKCYEDMTLWQHFKMVIGL